MQKDNNKKLANQIINNSTSSTWNNELIQLLTPILLEIYADSIDNAIATISVSIEPGQDVFQDLAQEYAQSRTAELVTKLDASTKDMLRSDLESYMNQGLTPAQIAKQLQDNYAFSETRSFTIARTETGFCWNNAGIMTAKAGGAKGVHVFDGDYDPNCQQADGENWTFDYAIAHLLQHPNCVRSFSPMSSDEDFDRGGEEQETMDQAASAVS